MRHWLTPRCILIVLMLIVAPGATLGHLLVTWAPSQFEIATLSQQVARHTQRLDAEVEQSIELQQQAARLQEVAVASAARLDWLPARDQHGVFDRMAEALRDQHVTIEQLTLDDPGPYAAVSYADLLACERVTAVCTGDYAGLTACLDRIRELDLPVRFKGLSWHRAGARLGLWLQLEVPFMPDELLRGTLAAEAGLAEEHDEP